MVKYGGPGGREQTLHTCGFCALHVGRFCGYTLTTNTGFGFKQITKGDLRVRTLNNSRHTLQNKRRFACPDITSILTLNKSRHTLQNKTRFLPKTLPVSRSKTLHVSRSKTLHVSRSKTLHVSRSKTLHVSRSKTLHVSRSKTLHFSRLIIF